MTKIWIKYLMALVTVCLTTQYAHSAPFPCSGDIYQVQTGQLRKFDPVLSQYVDVGPLQSSYNATGFNVQDNFAYGSLGDWIIRIHSDGTIENVHNVGFFSAAGDIDDNNTLWLRDTSGSAGAGKRLLSVNLANGNVTPINFTGQVQLSADIAYIKNGGTNYMISPKNTRVGIYNLDAGSSVRKNITGLPASGSFGASWADSAGRVFTFHNGSGEIYELLNLFSGAPTASLVAEGDPSGGNDGFSCNQAPFLNLPPLAMDDDFTTPVNTPVSGNVLLDNGNGVDADPDGTALTVTTTPVTGPSNGTVTIDAAGNFTYTPNNYFLGTDSFVYEITDASSLTATATVTIDVTGTTGFSTSKNQVSGPSPITAAGQVLVYEIALFNSGQIPLTNISIDDTLPDGSTATLPVPVETGATNPGSAVIGRLDVGETWTYSFSYTVTQSDMDTQSSLTNTVIVETDETGTPPQNTTAVTAITQSPNLSITKVASAPGFITGDLQEVLVNTDITYTYVIVNNGNITVDNISIGDTDNSLSVDPMPDGENLTNDGGLPGGSSDVISNDGIWSVLAPGDEVTFTSTQTVTQEDIDAL